MNHAYTNDPLNRLTATMRNTQANLTGGTPTNGPDNTIGWDGYVFNPATADYLVRHRTYLPPLGRWAERDPLGYFDSCNLLAAMADAPERFLDPLGTRLLHPGQDAKRIKHCLQKLCPGVDVQFNGKQWEFSAPVDDTFNWDEDRGGYLDHGGSCPNPCGPRINCGQAPGCAVLRAVIGTAKRVQVRHERDPANGSSDYDAEDMGKYQFYDGGTVHWGGPADVLNRRYGEKENHRTKISECEVLWHELMHPAHIAPSARGNPRGSKALGAEEIETIRELNRCSEWYNCYRVGAQGNQDDSSRPWLWRDPKGHGRVRAEDFPADFFRDDEPPSPISPRPKG